jgi:hypothetical protein
MVCMYSKKLIAHLKSDRIYETVLESNNIYTLREKMDSFVEDNAWTCKDISFEKTRVYRGEYVYMPCERIGN